MAQTRPFLLLLAAALVAAVGAGFWLLRTPSEQGGAANSVVGDASVRQPGSQAENADLEVVAPPTDIESRHATSLGPQAITEAPKVLPPRKVTESEKDTVRELIKQFSAAPAPDADPFAPQSEVEAWPTDDDSLFLKYGGFQGPAADEAIASLQAILDWQRDGPFENKVAEVLPEPIVRALEAELEWLRDYRTRM